MSCRWLVFTLLALSQLTYAGNGLRSPYSPDQIITRLGIAPPYFFFVAYDHSATDFSSSSVLYLGRLQSDGEPDSATVQRLPLINYQGPMLDGGTEDLAFDHGSIQLRKSVYRRTDLGGGSFRVDRSNEGLIEKGSSVLLLENNRYPIDSLITDSPRVGHWPAALLAGRSDAQIMFRFLRNLYPEEIQQEHTGDSYPSWKKNVSATASTLPLVPRQPDESTSPKQGIFRKCWSYLGFKKSK